MSNLTDEQMRKMEEDDKYDEDYEEWRNENDKKN